MKDTVMGPMVPQRLQDYHTRNGSTLLWVITRHPPDHPQDFVVRPYVDGKPLNDIAVCGTLPLARSYIPFGLSISPAVSDLPGDVVEVWR